MRDRDPRTRHVADIQVGDPMRNSKVTHVKEQTKDGHAGFRITLSDMRSAWGSRDMLQKDLQFERRGK